MGQKVDTAHSIGCDLPAKNVDLIFVWLICVCVVTVRNLKTPHSRVRVFKIAMAAIRTRTIVRTTFHT